MNQPGVSALGLTVTVKAHMLAPVSLHRLTFFAILLLAPVTCRADSAPQRNDYFGIQVVDDQTGRGVPMVELKTTSSVSYYTDSSGLIAFYEPGMMNRDVWFSISSDGYEFPKNSFGARGVKLHTRPGALSRLEIKRLNIAERLYRVTGEGIYRDTVLLGRKPPIFLPLLNAEVTGQDGVLNAVYGGKLYWFYGDTTRASFIMGNFSMTGATTELPGKIDPSVGFELHYFTGADGFVRAMAPMEGEGVVWLFGLTVLPDETGRERMMAYYQRRRGMEETLENGFVVYNDTKDQFEKFKTLPLNPPFFPTGYPFRATGEGGVEYIYFPTPYPDLRVKADRASYLDLSSYEAYTCLKPAAGGGTNEPLQLNRDAASNLVWTWRKNTPPLNLNDQQALIKAGRMKPAETPFRLRDASGGKPILLNNCSCCWNNYRHRYVMIASQLMGASMLGEVWYSESDRPEGPWSEARKIITHANKANDPHDFYNPVQHSFFDQEGGRVIYLEGSYVNTFSGNPRPTPYYEYNQIMYRLELSDPRLK
ncbi:MAG TPA: hypothetical protein VFC44_16285 [Candidatus Saccharimonadales bacterium]|nr:hypothetical protein [Candidatus Saccharimonadales bacterium]